VVLTTSYPREEIRPKKIGYAIAFFFLAILLIVWGGYSVAVGLMLGATGMIATGVLTIDEAYESVSWKTVFLLAGLIPLGLSMQTTHTSDWLIQHTLLLWQHLPLWGIQASLAVFTTALTFVLSSVGATIVLVPVALELALRVGGDPRMFALIVAVACSNTFVMPMQQANALIAGPGNYQIKDFFRLGSGLTILYWIIMLVVINLFFR
jgi:di/tricarboxylate transporter